jgi:hypothetical protein
MGIVRANLFYLIGTVGYRMQTAPAMSVPGNIPPLLGELNHGKMDTNSALRSLGSGFVHRRRKIAAIDEQPSRAGSNSSRTESGDA